MKRYGFGIAAVVVVLLSLLSAYAQSAPAGSNTQNSSSVATTSSQAQAGVQSQRVTAYTLPPDLYKKAHDRSRIRFQLALIGFAYGLFVLWLILHWKLAPKYRNWAERFSQRRVLQALVFAPLLLLTIAVLT
ncbi:MAG TPA: hypothetical protein VGU90_14140, partial [Terriglobales bacterium]|nr:hypothetical protein [Terriglobales bacterium]